MEVGHPLGLEKIRDTQLHREVFGSLQSVVRHIR
jgi:hypothetical protein